MTTYSWAILSFLFVAALETAAAATPPPAQPQDEFVVHKARGDAARTAGRLSEASDSYQKALALHHDPVVAGRLGLILLAQGAFDQAAWRLYPVVNDTSTSLSKAERAQFSRAYSDALREVCRIEITMDQAGASVEVDGNGRGFWNPGFWVFLMPGEHVIRARLSGFEDTVETIVTERDCQRTVGLEMRRAVATPPQLVVMPALGALGKRLVAQSSSLIEKDEASFIASSLYFAKPTPNSVKPSLNGRFVGGVGAWIPFGMTPSVGFGLQFQAGWRSRSWWELGADLRAAINLLGDGPISAGSVYIWAFAFTPCGHHRTHFFGCLLVQADGGTFRGIASWQLFAAGIRGGYEFHWNERVGVRAFVDVMVHNDVPETKFGNAPASAGNRWGFAPGFYLLRFF